MQRVYSLIVDNTTGVLSRISGLFSRRGYNVDSITSGVTADPRFTRITIVASGDELILSQIEKQVRKLEDVREIKVLNLFAYTGGASVACSYAGASVCHVDSSKGMVSWAKENIAASGLQDRPVRYIVDDVVKFVNREIRRGHTYDAIIMDPPSYGRGANGEVWKFEENLPDLIELCSKVLSDKPLFFLINSYTTGISSMVLENLLNLSITKEHKGKVSHGEIGLPMTNSKLILPCGIYGRWES